MTDVEWQKQTKISTHAGRLIPLTASTLLRGILSDKNQWLPGSATGRSGDRITESDDEAAPPSQSDPGACFVSSQASSGRSGPLLFDRCQKTPDPS